MLNENRLLVLLLSISSSSEAETSGTSAVLNKVGPCTTGWGNKVRKRTTMIGTTYGDTLSNFNGLGNNVRVNFRHAKVPKRCFCLVSERFPQCRQVRQARPFKGNKQIGLKRCPYIMSIFGTKYARNDAPKPKYEHSPWDLNTVNDPRSK